MCILVSFCPRGPGLSNPRKISFHVLKIADEDVYSNLHTSIQDIADILKKCKKIQMIMMIIMII